MTVYLVVFVVAVGIAYISESLQRGGQQPTIGETPRRFSMGTLLVAAVLAGVGALRWRVGTDYWTYERLFPRYAEEATQKFEVFGEPGLRVIAWLSMKVSGDSATMFALAAIITIGLNVNTLWRWSPSLTFCIAVYIVSGAWHGSFNGVRQFLACAILFAGHRYIVDRRMGKWVIVVGTAMLFHVSALVALLLYFVPTRQTSARTQVVVFTLGFAAMQVFGYALSLETSDIYTLENSYVSRDINPLRIAFSFVPIVLYWLLRTKEPSSSTKSPFYVNMLALYAATLLASASSAYMARFSIYLIPFLPIGLAIVTSMHSSKERFVVRAFVVLLYGVFFYVGVSGTPNLSNFQWIFERP